MQRIYNLRMLKGGAIGEGALAVSEVLHKAMHRGRG